MGDKKNRLFIFLCGFVLTNALVAEMVGTKIFSLESTFGFESLSINFLGLTLGFNLTAGNVMWPFVFIATDIINEYFGKSGVRRISIFTATLIAYAFLIIAVATMLPPSDFWLENNGVDAEGNRFNINYAFSTIFRQSLGIIFASLTAFLLGQFIDVYIFHRLKKWSGSRFIWLRATGSTMVSQLADSFVVVFIAFYVLGNWSFEQVASVTISNYIFKGLMAILLTPLIYLGHSIINRYLGRDHALHLADEAAAKSQKLF